MGTTSVSSLSMKEGRATTLYAHGVGPIDIQRWGRWKSPARMRYVWHGRVEMRTIISASIQRSNLSDQLLAHGGKRGRRLAIPIQMWRQEWGAAIYILLLKGDFHSIWCSRE